MPFAVAIAVFSLIGLSVAVLTTVRAEARSHAGSPASFTYRAYGA